MHQERLSKMAAACGFAVSLSVPVFACKPALRQVEVIAIANRAAVRAGYSLGDFQDPVARFEAEHKDCIWSVAYDGKLRMPGNYFLVIVRDRSKRTQVVGGK